MSSNITHQHVEIINQLGLQAPEEAGLEHLEVKKLKWDVLDHGRLECV